MAQKPTESDFRNTDLNQNIVSNIDNGIIILDESLTIHYYNRWLENHTGIKESEAINKTLNELFENINVKTLSRKVKTALHMGTPTFYTANTSKYLIPIQIDQLHISSFSYMQQDVSIIPFDRENSRVALIITDQTNMANANALLESNIKKIQELNTELIKERDTIDKKVLLIKFNTDGIITDVSQAHQRLLGFTKEEIEGLDFFYHERLHMKTQLVQTLKEHMQNKTEFEFEEKTLDSEGNIHWMNNSLVPEYDKHNKHIGFILFRDDITDSKNLQIHQEKLLTNSRSAAMGEMISMIAHQWRQPLSLINTIMGTLLIKLELQLSDHETIKESFQKIETTVHYLSNTIDDFRDFFKTNKKIDNVHIQEIIEKATNLLSEEMKIKEILFQKDINPDHVVTTYKNELIQCIINIVKNSVDAFESQNNVQRYISISSQMNATHLLINIEDNAGGIEKEVLAKIYEPYFSTKSKNGTGLGLYMSKMIVEKNLKGMLSISSEEGMTLAKIEIPHAIS